jgi:hypothetical protein
VAKRLGIRADNPRRSVISRFSWMTRYGAMRREIQTDDTGSALVTKAGRPRYGQRWGLTARGEQIALGKLSATQERTLEAISEDALVLAVRRIARRGLDAGDDTLETLVKREWRYTTSPLRALNGARR